MLSTGEVACLGKTFSDVFLKALKSTEFKIPPKEESVLTAVGGEDSKRKIIPLGFSIQDLSLKIYATERTAHVLQSSGVTNVTVLHKVREVGKSPNIVEYLTNGQIDLVINIPTPNPTTKYSEILKDECGIHRLAIEFSIPVLTNLELVLTITNILIHH